MQRKASLMFVSLVSLSLVGCGGGGGGLGSLFGSAGSSQASAPACTKQSTFFDGVFALTNAERQKAGLSLFSLSSELTQAAQAHSVDMASNNYFEHTGLDGSSSGDRARSFGYQYTSAGENIAAGRTSPEAVVQAWMDSPGHRANILNASYTEIGLGFFNNPASEYDNYWTQVFGDRPAASKTPVPASAIPDKFVDACVAFQEANDIAVKGWQSSSEFLSSGYLSDSSTNIPEVPGPTSILGFIAFGAFRSTLKHCFSQHKSDVD